MWRSRLRWLRVLNGVGLGLLCQVGLGRWQMAFHRFAEHVRVRIIEASSELLGEFSIPFVQHLKGKGGVSVACVLTDYRWLLGYDRLRITDWSH